MQAFGVGNLHFKQMDRFFEFKFVVANFCNFAILSISSVEITTFLAFLLFPTAKNLFAVVICGDSMKAVCYSFARGKVV